MGVKGAGTMAPPLREKVMVYWMSLSCVDVRLCDVHVVMIVCV